MNNSNTILLSLAAFAGTALLAAPAHAAQTAVDLFQGDFYPNYTTGNIVGQTAGPGLVGPWSADANTTAMVSASPSVVTAGSGNGRVGVGVNPWPEYSGNPGAFGGTTFLFRARMALGTGAGFQALELANSARGTSNILQLVGGTGLGIYSFNGAYTGAVGVGTNDGAYHEWLIELNTATGAGTVWLDGITPNATTPALPWAGDFNPAVGGTAFTASPGFTLGGINLASFGAASVSVDYLFISADGNTGAGPVWTDVGLTVVPEPSSAALPGLGALALLRRRRR
jgi:hypothetical protein